MDPNVVNEGFVSDLDHILGRFYNQKSKIDTEDPKRMLVSAYVTEDKPMFKFLTCSHALVLCRLEVLG